MKKLNLAFKISTSLMLIAGSVVLTEKAPLISTVLWVIAFIVMMKGQKYWLLIPLSIMFDMPAISFMGKFIETGELLIPLAFIIYLIERLKPDKMQIKKTTFDGLAVSLYAGWVFVIYFLYPSGFEIFGSKVFGARYYLKILLAFISYIVISSQRITEEDTRAIILFMVLGSFVMLFKQFIYYYTGSDYTNTEDQFYTWHQSIGNVALIVSAWAFSNYEFKDLFSPFKRLFWLYTGCVIAGLLSGKRAVFVAICIIPMIVSVFLKKQKGYLATIIFIVALAVLFIAPFINDIGRLLPVRAQRSLSSVLSEKTIDYRLANMGWEDSYRLELREAAWNIIRKNPIMGGKGYYLTEEEIAAGETKGRSWHTTWLGIAADFGVPAAIIWLLFYVQFFVCLNEDRKLTNQHTSENTLVSMQFILLIIIVLRSWHSGHSAISPYEMWWIYAVMVALKRTKLYDKEDQYKVQLTSLCA